MALYVHFGTYGNELKELDKLNSFPASGEFCRLLLTFADSLGPDQAGQNIWPDLDPNCLTLMVFLKDFLKKLIKKKKKKNR